MPDFDLPIDGILHTDCPHYYRYADAGESEEAFVDRIVGNLETLILNEGPETVAAFWAEPVFGSGGVIVPPKGYYESVQAILRKYDILFVADEVICGFGRTRQHVRLRGFRHRARHDHPSPRRCRPATNRSRR